MRYINIRPGTIHVIQVERPHYEVSDNFILAKITMRIYIRDTIAVEMMAQITDP